MVAGATLLDMHEDQPQKHLQLKVETSYLPIYNGASFGHYVDPHYNNNYYGYRTCTYQQMENAIVHHHGLYLAYKTL